MYQHKRGGGYCSNDCSELKTGQEAAVKIDAHWSTWDILSMQSHSAWRMMVTQPLSDYKQQEVHTTFKK